MATNEEHDPWMSRRPFDPMDAFLSRQDRPFDLLVFEDMSREIAQSFDFVIAKAKSATRRLCKALGGTCSGLARGLGVRRDATYSDLAAYAAGELDETRRSAIAAHLSGCARCRQRLESLNDADEVLAALPNDRPSRRAMQMAVVGAAVANLPARQREALAMRTYRSMGYREIAEALEMSSDEAERLVLRARANIARALEPITQGSDAELPLGT
ncbi:MAG: zf-HC2 domain-containing protein [Phycisphaerae bacterium]|nr:zf-HC2 domain-containing protein [Phycisphaerae bacterium]